MASTTLDGVLLKGVAASRPAANAVAKGTIYSATDTGAITQSDGVSTWSTFATISAGFSDPMTTRGDIIVRNASNATARLAIGSTGKVLQSDGTDISWQTPSGGGVASGTSFPGSPSTNDLYFRTDRGIIYFYDGTRWLSVHLYKEQAAMGDQVGSGANAGAALIGRNTMWGADYDLYVVSLYASAYVASPNSGTNYWVFTLSRIVNPNTKTTVGTVNTSTGAADGYVAYSSSVGTVVSKSTTNAMFQIDTSKNNGPGSLYWSFAFTYRLVG